MNLEGISIIGYGRAARAGKPTPPINPRTREPVEPDYFWATESDVERAAELAAGAFAVYRAWPARRRSGLLRRIAELLESNRSGLTERGQAETALPLARLQGELARTCGQLRLFATLIEDGWWLDPRIDHGDPNRKPAPKPDVRSMLVPLGPVAVFSSSNFPLAFSVAGGDTASALAAGCPVLVKPHQGHLGLSEMVGLLVLEAVRECDAPEGLFSLLFGPGRETGLALVRHPLIKAVGFTGSRAGGRALMDAAAARPEPIPVYAEMGSINPVFLLSGILHQSAESLAAGLHGSVTLGVGQFCTNPGLVFLEAGPSAQPFIAELTRLMNATAPGTMLNSSICSAYHNGIEKFSNTAGVRRATGASVQGTGMEGHAALFTTEAEIFLKTPSLMEEVFGPSTLLVQCSSPGQMLAAAEKLEGQLTATVHGTPEELAAHRPLLDVLQTKAGRVLCNGFPTGVEVCHAMNHGGPYPATADGRSTSVGTRAIERFTRPVCFQNFPDQLSPPELQEANPLGLWRLVDGQIGKH
jgi:NADP-dependent aldehyde dehydrogenase